MKRKICVVTGTRAEYGLLRWIMEGIRSSDNLELQLIVTGMHLSPEFGLTYQDIEKDGFIIDYKVEMLISSDTPIAISKSIGLGVIGFAEALNNLKPDILMLLGDRYELLAASSAALIARIPIAHLHGGERTEGAFDESIRHSITKMAFLHFVSAEEYRRRVIQLGESPDRVFNVGGLGVDSIRRMRLLDKEKLEETLNFKFGKKNLLITFHPVTLEQSTAESQMNELLAALDSLIETNLIFTMPNSDTEGRIIFNLINEFVKTHRNSCAFTSLGQLRYFSTICQVDGVVGNSSSGLLEVPSFKKGTINIGDRQRGRLKATSVIDCQPIKEDILKSINLLYQEKFQSVLRDTVNPYGDGGASDRIIQILEKDRNYSSTKKVFFDLLGIGGFGI
ncbi:UDP-N-acetylglucosamine 2-epimerase [Leptospira santarosai]|uniref:UDP-N-acetylglucosamine 2-epimerase n=1 Tax=Leptospira santarosai TaxID=28183 RepID=UPI0002E53505|nr:UDP-N-acetylglucosamine 2-epimerase [Leptospira santarosai]